MKKLFYDMKFVFMILIRSEKIFSKDIIFLKIGTDTIENSDLRSH